MTDRLDADERPDRTPIVLGVIAAVLLVAVIVAVSILFSRQSANDAPPPAPASSEAPPATGPSDDESAAPEEPEEVEPSAMIALNGRGFTLVQADGTEFSHTWADDPQAAIDALTELFGEEPTEDFQNGDAENWAYNIYVWDGLRFYDVFLGDGGRSRGEVPAPTYVTVTGGAPSTVGMGNEFGVAIGDPIDRVRALDPVDEVELSGGGVRLVLGEGRGTFYNDGERTFSAFVQSDAAGDEVATITYTFRARGQ
ncbi:hypothetical protein AB3M83_02040 [Microbacterium sp. 179-B 1A2 NHS]|uniref:hypothetical protein n=1 Tax=Microbacterium sp. 179-B 1A2 NHS TaxID=3142383 RepID=UPI0039A2C772